jgi:hypothetical protein
MEQAILVGLIDNWGVISATAMAVIVGADKIFLVLITTLGNIRDAWMATFPKTKTEGTDKKVTRVGSP